MGMAGFKERSFRDDDPLVCSCGITLGTRLLEKPGNEAQLAYTMEGHKAEHARRMQHQARHASLDGPCPECR